MQCSGGADVGLWPSQLLTRREGGGGEVHMAAATGQCTFETFLAILGRETELVNVTHTFGTGLKQILE